MPPTLTPPVELILSTAKSYPLWVCIPLVAYLPVKESAEPNVMVSPSTFARAVPETPTIEIAKAVPAPTAYFKNLIFLP